jgi:hypothetical protein
MQLKKLEKYINTQNIDEAIKTIEELGNNKNTEAVHCLIKHLETTDNNVLRNAIAIALADIGCDTAIEPLIRMLKSPKTKGARGTILYALEYFDCSSHVELLTDLLFDENFEVSRQSLVLIESFLNKVPFELKQKCIQKVKNKIQSLHDIVHFLEDSLDILKGEKD